MQLNFYVCYSQCLSPRYWCLVGFEKHINILWTCRSWTRRSQSSFVKSFPVEQKPCLRSMVGLYIARLLTKLTGALLFESPWFRQTWVYWVINWLGPEPANIYLICYRATLWPLLIFLVQTYGSQTSGFATLGAFIICPVRYLSPRYRCLVESEKHSTLRQARPEPDYSILVC